MLQASIIDIIYILSKLLQDIDDKIINRALQEKKPWKEIASFYEHEFFSSMKALNVSNVLIYS